MIAEIIVIEDDEVYWMDWKVIGKLLNLKLNLYHDLEDFEENFNLNTMANQKAIFVDYDLGRYNAIKINIGKIIKEKYNYDGPIVLMSILDSFIEHEENTYREYYSQKMDKKEDLKIENIKKIKNILGIS